MTLEFVMGSALGARSIMGFSSLRFGEVQSITCHFDQVVKVGEFFTSKESGL